MASGTISPSRSARIVGLGLIGGSIGLGLRAAGWHVTGEDVDPGRVARAVEAGALDEAGGEGDGEIVFVATPAAQVADAALRLLASGPADRVVTDVAGVKETIVRGVGSPRFVGGHPMAGSEQEGIAGAEADLFAGATWVLTPDASTDPASFARVRQVVSELGADVVALPPERHDALVAMVSHVPHLTAATLMSLAGDASEEHGALLRLAAGGFRDMTRIAAGHPGIWPDICTENSVAILAALDDLLRRLGEMRSIIAGHDRARLLAALEQARTARRNLPARAPRPESTVELRVPVPDRPGVLAEVTTLAGELGVNIYDLEIAHSSEGDRGVLVLALAVEESEKVRIALADRGYRSSVTRVE